MYDDKVREFVKNIGIENIGKRLVNSRDGAVGHPAVSLPHSPSFHVSVLELWVANDMHAGPLSRGQGQGGGLQMC